MNEWILCKLLEQLFMMQPYWLKMVAIQSSVKIRNKKPRAQEKIYIYIHREQNKSLNKSSSKSRSAELQILTENSIQRYQLYKRFELHNYPSIIPKKGKRICVILNLKEAKFYAFAFKVLQPLFPTPNGLLDSDLVSLKGNRLQSSPYVSWSSSTFFPQNYHQLMIVGLPYSGVVHVNFLSVTLSLQKLVGCRDLSDSIKWLI